MQVLQLFSEGAQKRVNGVQNGENACCNAQERIQAQRAAIHAVEREGGGYASEYIE